MKRFCILLLLFSSLHIYVQPAAESLRNKAITLKRFLDKNHNLPVQ